MQRDSLIPQVAVVLQAEQTTPDVKTFKVVDQEGNKPFEHMPGQCAMVSLPGVGEAIFSITSSPTNKDFLEFSIKSCGCVTEALHSLEDGSQITVRGPYGRNFPVDTFFKGKDLLFIAGGIGLAPLRSVINYVRDNREDYGKVTIIYGAKTPEDIVFKQEIESEWKNTKDFNVYLTIDKECNEWTCHVGYVPAYLKELNVENSSVAVLCGPPAMIKYTLEELLQEGFKKENIYTTLELRMKCGIGKCGRCNVGNKLVCKDGPVFSMEELECLPDEY